MFKKKVQQLDDGDSGKFSDGTRFRLNNVRCPEKHQFGGSKATRTAAGMIGRSKGRVNVSVVGKDRYGRKIVNLSNKDGSINKRMRNKGYTNKGR